MTNIGAVCVHWGRLRDLSPIRVILQRRVSYDRNVYEESQPETQIAALREPIELLTKEVPDFSVKFIELDKQEAARRHRRRLVAARKDELLRGTAPCPVAGIWIATVLDKGSKRYLIAEACRAAGIAFKSLSDLELVRAAQPRLRTNRVTPLKPVDTIPRE